MAKISENVYLDEKKKIVRVVFDDATDGEMKMVNTYVSAGYTLRPKKKSTRKGDNRKKEWFEERLTNAADKKEFEKLCKKSFLTAKKWFDEKYPDAE